MVRGKLILICQSGGEFLTNSDGSLSYSGGEAHAVDINCETLFEDLKLKLAEVWNLDFETLSIKYFLPGNRRTLITLSNDKDLKRMIDFHGNAVTAEIFVTGKEGFDREALNMHISRVSGIKLAETVNRIAASQASPPVAVDTTATPPYHMSTVASAAAVNGTRVAPVNFPVSPPADSVAAIDATIRSLVTAVLTSNTSPHASADDFSSGAPTPNDHAAVAADATTQSPIIMDMNCTPADTVKKRRRTASWKIGANGPTIVAIPDNIMEKRKYGSGRKNTQSHNYVAIADDVEQQRAIVPTGDYTNTLSSLANSNDSSLENLVASWKNGIEGVDQEFKSVTEFRDALQKYAIAHQFVYRLKKNDSGRASGICVAEGCSWRIHASWVPSEQVFRIKKMNKTHTCGGESWKSAHPTKNWLVGIIKDRLGDTPHHKPKEIANSIFRDFGIELSYSQVWRAIEDAKEQLQGSYKESYDQLPWLCEKVVETNPGTVAKLVTNEEQRFQRLFISFHASIQGFHNGCRPLLFLDAMSLKSKYQEILLVATAVDGNDGFFPIAFAVVDVENDDSWHWFLEQLKSAVSTSGSITFISDREKGLQKSVLEVFENVHLGYSIHHLLENFKKNLKGPFHGDGRNALPGSLLAAAHAVRLDGYKKYCELIKQVSSNAYDWVMQIEPEYWTTALFKGEAYNHLTVNVAESYTKVIEEVRELPIIQKIEALRCMMMELMENGRMVLSKWSTKLTPSKEVKLQEETLKAKGLKVLFSSDTLFEVHDDAINVVNIDKWDCTCLGWKTTGLPCRHAIAVFNCKGKSVYDYCSKYFTVDSYRLTYSESINPLPGNGKPVFKEDGAPEGRHVLPPFISRPHNQQKRERPKKEKVLKRIVFCTRCKESGHNKATCKATL